EVFDMAQSRDGMDRREFTERALMAMLAGVTITITGCGSHNGVAPEPLPGVKLGTIANNHGHEVLITTGQQMAGGSVALNIQGARSPDHMLATTARPSATT